MTVYIDELRHHQVISSRQARRYGNLWCHLWADSVEELHSFAGKIGCKRGWFQNHHKRFPHYDLTPNRRLVAIRAGATPTSLKVYLRLLRS